MKNISKLKWALLNFAIFSPVAVLAGDDTLMYTEDHAWLRVDGDVITVGFTQHAIDMLGEVSFVQPASAGTVLNSSTPLAVVETAKAATDIHIDIGGRVIATNPEIVQNPSNVVATHSGAVGLSR